MFDRLVLQHLIADCTEAARAKTTEILDAHKELVILVMAGTLQTWLGRY